jgi:hypothetical protein
MQLQCLLELMMSWDLSCISVIQLATLLVTRYASHEFLLHLVVSKGIV